MNATVVEKNRPAFEYVHGDSAVHSIGPGIKFIFVAASSAMAFQLESLPVLLAGFLSILSIMVFAGIGAANIRRDLKILVYQLVFTVPLGLMTNGFNSAALMLIAVTTVRFGMMVSAASLMMRTTDPWKLYAFFEKVLGRKLAFLVLVAQRYIPVLSAELKEIGAVQALRSDSAKLPGIKGARVKAEALLVPLAQRSVRTAEEIAVAAYARGVIDDVGE